MKIEFFMNDLKHNILMLPKDIQKKIYIWTWRKFWREYVPLTAQIPSWYERKVVIEDILFKSKIKYKYKRKEYIKLSEDFSYFYEIMPGYDPACIKYLEDYDPFCGSGYEDQDRYELRTNTKTKFDTTIVNYYTQLNNETS